MNIGNTSSQKPLQVEVTDWRKPAYFPAIQFFLGIKFTDLICIKRSFPFSMKALVSYALEEILRDRFYLRPINEELALGTGIPVLDAEGFNGDEQPHLWEGFFFVEQMESREKLVIYLNNGDRYCEPLVSVYVTSDQVRLGRQIFDWIEMAQRGMRRLVMTGSGRLLKIREDVKWDEIILPEEIKQLIYRNTIGFLEQRHRFKKIGLPIKRGLLIYGHPGTGKSLIGKFLAIHSDANFIWVTPKDLPPGRGAESIENIFNLARVHSPAIILFDDVDLTGVLNRHDPTSQSSVIGELLAQMDGIESDNEGIITLATTNLSNRITSDRAFRPGRFDHHILFDLPSIEQRIALLKLFTRRVSLAEDVEFQSLSIKTEGLSPACIREVVQRAAMETLETNTETSDGVPVLTHGKLLKAITLLKERKKEIGFAENREQGNLLLTNS